MSTMNLWIGVGGIALGTVLAAYAVAYRKQDAGIGDAAWSGGLALSALWLALMADGNPAQRWALVLLTVPWGGRLAWFILRHRVMGHTEDARYATLRERWGAQANRYFFGIFLMQGLLILLFSLPLWAVASQPGNGLGLVGIAGLLLGWGAIAGEITADTQLRRWRAQPENQGQLLRSGLWRYSRHPNYFFEWLHWWAYVLLAWGDWRLFLALLGPACMYVFLVHITGIPPAETRALARRGAAFEAYQRSTNKFFPWPPRE